MTFLYTYCPDVCPVIAGNLNAALRTAPARRAGLRVLSVSVDPERDTPGGRAPVRPRPPAAPTFSLAARHAAPSSSGSGTRTTSPCCPGPKKTVSHSTVQLLIDPEGRERLLYDAEVQTADVVADLKTLAKDDDG